MQDKIENFIENVKTVFRIIALIYILFCIIMWSYYMIDLHGIPNENSFFTVSAHIGFMFIMLILMLFLICT